MTNATPSSLGQINGAGSTDALFLKVFPGEVMGAFDETNVMEGLHTIRNIQSGKSAQFPATGKATAAYHTPGNQLLGTNQINHAERIINIDSLLVSDVFVANIDEAMNHYDVRGEYAKQLGSSLARKFDQQTLQVAILAARAAATVTGGNGGSQLSNLSAKTDGDVLAGMVFDAAQTLDEKDVPEDDRYCVIKPAQYYLLVQTTKVLNRDWGGSGVYADGKVMKAAGISFVKSNNLPTSLISAEAGTNNAYDGDFTNTAASVFHKSAVGTVKLLGLATEKEYQISRQGTLMVAKYAMGHGILRPEASVELVAA
jgi:hypothetical protein